MRCHTPHISNYLIITWQPKASEVKKKKKKQTRAANLSRAMPHCLLSQLPLPSDNKHSSGKVKAVYMVEWSMVVGVTDRLV